MKKLIAILMLVSCATVNPYAYEEAASCPGPNMSAEQHASGVVRCRALCSSYARDLDYYGTDCKCFCKSNKPPVYGNQM